MLQNVTKRCVVVCSKLSNDSISIRNKLKCGLFNVIVGVHLKADYYATYFQHASDGPRVVGNDKEQESTSFFHGELVGYETLTPAGLKLWVIERHAMLPAVNNIHSLSE